MNQDKLVADIRKKAIDHFPMHRKGIHGTSHWERVHENGLYLAKHAKADIVVVRLFAYLHDCCRYSDGADPEHGVRAAEFASRLHRHNELAITEAQLESLVQACKFHDKGDTSEDPTIGSCWDADRLDLARVGVRPNPEFLSTKRAKTKAVIEWGYKRSRGHAAKLKA